jgi:hypothetical protein
LLHGLLLALCQFCVLVDFEFGLHGKKRDQKISEHVVECESTFSSDNKSRKSQQDM